MVTVAINEKGICEVILPHTMTADVAARLRDIAQDIQYDTTINVIILRSEIAAFASPFEQQMPLEYSLQQQVVYMCEAWQRLYQPIIAVIEGQCANVGLAIACLADFRICNEAAVFYSEEVQQGMMPLGATPKRLVELIGQGTAMHMLLSGYRVSAQEAQHRGFALVVDDAYLHAKQLASTLVQQSALAMKYTKESIVRGMDMTFQQALLHEMDLYMLLQTSTDRMEGVNAYLEKRPPHFKGE